jgi:hypothetical protein
MPSSATITASTFYVFAPGDRPRIGQMNANFNFFRGTIFPVDPNTLTGASVTYDLGSEDYRWRTIYARKLDMSTPGTATATYVYANTAGEFVFENGGNATIKLKANGFVGGNAETNVLYDATTFNGQSAVASVGDMAVGSQLNLTITADTQIAGSTCTLTTLGRPVMLWLQPHPDTSTASYLETYGNTTGVGIITSRLSFLRNGSTIAVLPIYSEYAGMRIPPTLFKIFDLAPAGANVYSLAISKPQPMNFNGTTITTATVAINIQNARFHAYEL